MSQRESQQELINVLHCTLTCHIYTLYMHVLCTCTCTLHVHVSHTCTLVHAHIVHVQLFTVYMLCRCVVHRCNVHVIYSCMLICVTFSSPSPSSSPSLPPLSPPPSPSSMEVPVLWVRVDPDYQWIRHLAMEQADTVWHCLLKYERDANAQLDALEALEAFQTNQTRDAFRDTILNSNFYYCVRQQAAKSLSKVS